MTDQPDRVVSRIPKPGRKTRAFFSNRTAVIGSVGLTLIVFAVVFAGTLSPYNPNDQDLVHTSAGPSWSHPLGTDDLGRDILSRLLHGGQVSLLVAVSVILIGALIALPIGLFSGYVGGATDNVVMRVMDAGLAFPALVLTLAIVGVLGKGTQNVILALMIVTIPGFVRLVRGQTLAVSQETYVEASQSIGTPPARMVRKRVFPNVRSPLIVIMALGFGGMLIAEAGLSFLGLGAQPPTASWGNMLREAYDYQLFTHPWQLAPPAVAILLTVLAFNAIGDGLRDSLGVARHTGSRGRAKRGLTTVARDSDARPADGAAAGADPAALLTVRDLRVEFDTEHGAVEVLDGVSLDVGRGEVVGLVGESGSGKTVTAMSVMRLLSSPPGRVSGGSIWFQGRDLLSLSFKEMRKLRGSEIAMVFQDPMTSLDPAFTVGSQLVEAQRLHGRVSRRAA
ncbi:MAG TPA: ABC transporter permease subunit, partial [Acidimicrobiia bacterium]|nr:ABC transporter permease subunit [Acidimicrobiia bacterium]